VEVLLRPKMCEITFLTPPEALPEALVSLVVEVEVVQGWVNSQGGSWSWGSGSCSCCCLVGVGVGWRVGLDGLDFGFGSGFCFGLGAMVSPVVVWRGRGGVQGGCYIGLSIVV
jgi:hypothetical protein